MITNDRSLRMASHGTDEIFFDRNYVLHAIIILKSMIMQEKTPWK